MTSQRIDVVSDPGARHRLVTGEAATVISGTVVAAVPNGILDVQAGPWIIGLAVAYAPPGLIGTTVTATVTTVTVSPYEPCPEFD